MKIPYKCLETQGITICKVLKKSLKSKINGAVFESLAVTGFQTRVFYHFTHFHKKDK